MRLDTCRCDGSHGPSCLTVDELLNDEGARWDGVEPVLVSCEVPQFVPINGRWDFVPCGKCLPCLKRKAFMTECAGVRERATHKDVLSFTLTVNVENLAVVRNASLRPVRGVFGYDLELVKELLPARFRGRLDVVARRLFNANRGRVRSPAKLRELFRREYGIELGPERLLAETDFQFGEHGEIVLRRYKNVVRGLDIPPAFMDVMSDPELLNKREIHSNFDRGRELLAGFNKDSLEYRREVDRLNYVVGRTLVERDYTLFWKQLRILFERCGEPRLSEVRFRFAGCGEYGSKVGRPHYHGTIFGVPYLCDRKHGQDEFGLKCDHWFCKLFREAWPHGGVAVSGETDDRWLSYVVKDQAKSMRRPKDDEALQGRIPEFWRSSNRGGAIGGNDKCADEVEKYISVKHGVSLEKFHAVDGDVPVGYSDVRPGRNPVYDLSGPEVVIRRQTPNREIVKPFNRPLKRRLRERVFNRCPDRFEIDVDTGEPYLGTPQDKIDEYQIGVRKGAGLSTDLKVKLSREEALAKILEASNGKRSSARAKDKVREQKKRHAIWWRAD